MKLKFIYFLTSIVSLTFGILFIHTMITSSNGNAPGYPEWSRFADINGYHEGYFESIVFLLIGIFGLYNLNNINEDIKK